MSPSVLVFPGQGVQKQGMAADFVERFAVSRAVFDEASDAIGLNLRALCFDDDPRLGLTEFTQPAIVTAEIAMFVALRAHHGVEATRFGGHSLGEFTALVAAGAFSLAAAVRLVRRRGALMQGAVPVGEGAMVAVAREGLDLDAVAAVAAELGLDVANLNSPSQVVLSGPAAGVAAATPALEALAKVIPLDVHAPFHSRLMRGIEPAFREALAAETFDAPRARAVTSNFTGGFHTGEREDLVEALTRQIGGAVRWIDNMTLLAEGGAVLEVGPGRPLTRFFKDSGHEAQSVLSVRTAEKLFGEARG